MINYTLEQLNSLLTDDREKLTQICAEVCYGLKRQHVGAPSSFAAYHWVNPNTGNVVMNMRAFQPLDNTEKGKSQAFDLAVKFNQLNEVKREDPQSAIVIAAILIAQQEN